jgi:glycosyltransferase involved in cell wall biosynthesis
MRLLGLVPYPYDKAPGQRYRIEQWAPTLAKFGVQVTFEAFRCNELHELLCKPGNNWRKISLTAQAMVRRLKVLRQINKYDLVYVYNEAALLGPALAEHYVSRNVPFVFDFDDAIFLHYTYISPVNRYLRLLKFPGKTRSICRMASQVIVGNSYLAEYARQVNDNVTIIPTTIDTDKFKPLSYKKKTEPLVIGWTGSYSTVQHLDTLRNTLKKLAGLENFRLRVIGTPSYQIDGVEVEASQWRADTELDDLSGIDIGVMPLPDDNWSKGKCGLKALQFMALGIPTVCSPVGVNTDIIQDNENGMLASTEDEWIEKLTLLLKSSDLRERLGKAGRATIEAHYSKTLHAPRVLRIFKSALNGHSEKRSPEVFTEIEERPRKVDIVHASVLNDEVDA